MQRLWQARMACALALSQQRGRDADLSVFKGHELHVVPSEKTLTFEHSYTWWGECLGTPDFIGSCGINLCYRYLHISIGMNSNNERSPLLMTKFA